MKYSRSSVTSAASMSTMESSFKNLAPSISILLLSALIPVVVNFINKKYILQNKFLYRAIFVAAFGLNLFTVQIPGRFDSQAAEAMKDNNLDKFPWRTVFSPSGWTFAIWGVIYLSEMILTIYVGVKGEPLEAVRSATSFWLMGNIFQSIWCFCFRPSFINQLWVPATQLAFGAVSFGLAHTSLTQSILAESNQFWKFVLYAMRFPFSLHMTWLTAATLLNVNAWAVVSNVSLSSQLSLATACAYVTTLLGGLLSWKLNDPLIGLTVAWALAGLADRTKKTPEVKGMPAVATESLAQTESIMSTALIAFSLLLPFTGLLGHLVQNASERK